MEDGTCEQEDPAQLRQQLKEARNEIEKLRQGLSQKLYYFVLTRSFAYYTVQHRGSVRRWRSCRAASFHPWHWRWNFRRSHLTRLPRIVLA